MKATLREMREMGLFRRKKAKDFKVGQAVVSGSTNLVGTVTRVLTGSCGLPDQVEVRLSDDELIKMLPKYLKKLEGIEE